MKAPQEIPPPTQFDPADMPDSLSAQRTLHLASSSKSATKHSASSRKRRTPAAATSASTTPLEVATDEVSLKAQQESAFALKPCRPPEIPGFLKEESNRITALQLPSHQSRRRIPALQLRQQQSQIVRQRFQAGIKRLEMRANYINELSTQLESALYEIKAIAGDVYRDQAVLAQSPHAIAAGSRKLNHWDYATATVPQVRQETDGGFVLTMRQIDLLKAEREAEMNAQFLRRRRRGQSSRQRRDQASNRKNGLSHNNNPSNTISKTIINQTRAVRHNFGGRLFSRLTHLRMEGLDQAWIREVVGLPRGLIARIGDAVAWIAVAAAVRIGLQVLMAAYPAFWLPTVLLLVIPVLIAAYQITFMTQSGIVWGYRLLLVLVGLLLGGRL